MLGHAEMRTIITDLAAAIETRSLLQWILRLRRRSGPYTTQDEAEANNVEGSQYRSASGSKVPPGDLLPAVTSRTHPEMRMSSREMRDIFKSMARLADQRRLTGKHVQKGGKLICVGVNKNDLERAHVHVPLSKGYPWLTKSYSYGPIGGNSGRTATTTATPGGSGSFAGYDTPTLPKSSLGGIGRTDLQKTVKYRYTRTRKGVVDDGLPPVTLRRRYSL
ncbi:hypothetical protein Pmar_PMAR000414 [Perkinsus marinus ATCC 50983]|uniref:Uncharacterized protein n=1 Tax=Perkinsus marinus (strain ATCC 50983 / TXsc) TaxID=423536 RepID=C5L4D8_PERM5|nr:hypothetical protein Pmar_PMAR000414 [Perkinsus marinus ATCC 50983]EER08375.1 hypothetical protein Pmar_PMAR000414 [Perkinsus marinus ATCC 50983]|eukprot:XP_002776559.1 hypothetical protein Pmar_PMAR000414 [Perkinsus marinus ATCC 50983]